MYRFVFAVFIVLCLLRTYSFADQIAMSNGDRLSGAIVKSDGKELVIKTEFAGEVTVKWSAITEINSTDPLHVAVRDGQTLVGQVQTSQGNLEVETREKGPVFISKDSISSLRNQAEQTTYEKSLLQGYYKDGMEAPTSVLLSRAATARPRILLSPLQPTARLEMII